MRRLASKTLRRCQARKRQVREINLRIERIHGDLILCGIADETLALRERDIGGSRPVALVIGDDLNTIVLPNTDTANKSEDPVGSMQPLDGGYKLTSRLCQDRYR